MSYSTKKKIRFIEYENFEKATKKGQKIFLGTGNLVHIMALLLLLLFFFVSYLLLATSMHWHKHLHTFVDIAEANFSIDTKNTME